MDFRQLKTFVEVAKVGSLSKTAAKMHIAQPALSRQMRMLEEELLVRLFERHGRGMRMTEAGELLFTRARAILGELEDIRHDLASQEKTVRGKVRVGLPPTVSDVLAATLIEKFYSIYPQVELRVIPAFSGFLMDFLNRNEVDLAVVYGVERGLNVDLIPLVKERLYLVGPSRAELSRQTPVSFSDALEKQLILPSPSHGLRALIEREARRRHTPLKIPVEVDALQTIKELVSRDMGFTILPLAAVHGDIGKGALTAARIGQPEISRKLVVARPSGQPWSNAVKLFSEMLHEEIRSMVDANIIDGKLL